MLMHIVLLCVAHFTSGLENILRSIAFDKHLLTVNIVNNHVNSSSSFGLISTANLSRTTLIVENNFNETRERRFQLKRSAGFRYSQPSNIIFLLIHCKNFFRFDLTEQFKQHRPVYALHSSVIFIITELPSKTKMLRKCSLTNREFDEFAKYSATKFFINLTKSFSNVSLLSSQFSRRITPIKPEFILSNSLINSVKTHGLLFKTGDGYSVGVSVYLSESEFFEPQNYGNDRLACRKKLLFKSVKSYFCTFDIMAVSELGSVHNLSMQVLNFHNGTELKGARSKFNSQMILNKKSFKIDSILRKQSLPQSLFFLLYYPEQLVYCRNLRIGTVFHPNFKTWTGPLSREIWIPALVTIIMFFMVPKYRSKVLTIVGMFLRQSQSRSLTKTGSRKLILASLLGMVMCMLYENMLVSFVVVPEALSTFQTSKQMLLAGYKIFWWARNYADPKGYMQDLQRRGLAPQHINISFYYYTSDRSPKLCEKAEKMNQSDVEVAVFSYSGNVDFTIQGLERCFIKSGCRKRCYSVPDMIMGLPIFWEIHGVSRVWLEETLVRLRESGFKERWNHWSQYNYKLFQKYSHRVKKRHFDRINISKIAAIVILWICLNLFCGVVFILEKKWTNLRTSMLTMFEPKQSSRLAPIRVSSI